MIKQCENCGNTYNTAYAQSKFCSTLCSNRKRAELCRIRRNANTKSCKRCNKTFVVKKKVSDFCSLSCAKRKLSDKICEDCKVTFHPQTMYTRFCCAKCRDAGKSEIRSCKHCNESFKVHNRIINRGKNAGNFCSQTCYTEFSKGSNNPNWRGGELKRIVTKTEWRIISSIVKDRDNHTCVKCGKTGLEIKLDVDHIIPYRIVRHNKIDNLQTLCINCHRQKAGEELRLLKSMNAI